MAAKRNSTKKAAPKTSKRVSPVSRKTTSSSNKQPSLFQDFFRVGESYTSMVLGIIVVIAVAALLVNFSRARMNNAPETPSKDISATSTSQLSPATATPSQLVVTEPTNTPTFSPSATPTTVVIPTAVPTQVAQPTIIPTLTPQAPAPVPSGKTYTVRAGDDLWNIAVHAYGDGYQWVNIARSNNLTNPDIIAAGTTIQLPTKDDSIPSSLSQPNNPSNAPPVGMISGSSYTVRSGDDLWDIAVRAYGNGYRWVDIAKANNLTMPGVIHTGNTLQLPR